MRATGRILTAALGLLLFAGIPYGGPTAAWADPGSGRHGDGGCGCDCGCKKGHGGAMHRHGMTDNTTMCGGSMHRHGAHMGERHGMKGAMTDHAKGMRETIGKLRSLEAKMETLKGTDDAAAFRAASLEHGKLLTDLQESHLKRMEEMTGIKGADDGKGK